MKSELDDYFNEAKKWREEMLKLRSLVLDSGLIEELKWGSPCYTYQNHNVIMIGGFKDSCVLSFLKGSLMQDSARILSKPGENTQVGRVIRFTSLKEIVEMEPLLKTYIQEAIKVEKSGVQAVYADPGEFVYAEELLKKLEEDPALRAAFEALTPGRKKAYNLHFSAAKQPATRISRIEKYRLRILDGKGINDCTCGLSKKMPACDGSHKFLR